MVHRSQLLSGYQTPLSPTLPRTVERSYFSQIIKISAFPTCDHPVWCFCHTYFFQQTHSVKSIALMIAEVQYSVIQEVIVNLILNVPKNLDQLVSKTQKFIKWVCTQTENNTPGISIVVRGKTTLQMLCLTFCIP